MRVLISGGGTGGHLFPAIAVAQALSQREPDSALLYVGRRGGIEEQLVPRHGLRGRTIVAAQPDMEQFWRHWSGPFVGSLALLQAVRVGRELRAGLPLGTRGSRRAPGGRLAA